ncbi:TetR family transcriptional regulator [Streptomyces sp. NPDC001744]|uniref:TetR family transcriptional regulator n=1 Tax=Streptomyces sp. NPDC001744 TaxID=3364606 RepID=UPI0036A44994
MTNYGRSATKQERGGRTRALLIQAAGQEFALRGYAGTSLTRISRAAMATIGALTFHFPAKNELAEAVCERGCALTRAAVAREVREARSPAEGIAGITEVLAVLLEEEDVVRAAARLSRELPVEHDWRDSWAPAVHSLLSAAHRDGELREEDLETVGVFVACVVSDLEVSALRAHRPPSGSGNPGGAPEADRGNDGRAGGGTDGTGRGGDAPAGAPRPGAGLPGIGLPGVDGAWSVRGRLARVWEVVWSGIPGRHGHPRPDAPGPGCHGRTPPEGAGPGRHGRSQPDPYGPGRHGDSPPDPYGPGRHGDSPPEAPGPGRRGRNLPEAPGPESGPGPGSRPGPGPARRAPEGALFPGGRDGGPAMA